MDFRNISKNEIMTSLNVNGFETFAKKNGPSFSLLIFTQHLSNTTLVWRRGKTVEECNSLELNIASRGVRLHVYDLLWRIPSLVLVHCDTPVHLGLPLSTPSPRACHHFPLPFCILLCQPVQVARPSRGLFCACDCCFNLLFPSPG